MPRIPRLRVIIETEPHSGEWNMAVDEALLETAIASNVATLRWYQWSEPTISLGYFQKLADVNNDAVLSQLPIVRRLSGGGAILHDDELTYSISLPASQRLFQLPQQLYDIVHQGAVRGLQQFGFPVSFREKSMKQMVEPLMCFQRQDIHDLVLSGQKILGSAQRRRHGAIMQHGSLIRRASALAPQIPGLTDLCPLPIPEDLAEILSMQIAEGIAESFVVESMTDTEIEMAEKILLHHCTNV